MRMSEGHVDLHQDVDDPLDACRRMASSCVSPFRMSRLSTPSPPCPRRSLF